MKNSQKSEILAYLKTGRTLDPMQALNLFDCWSLSQRISDLRNEGYPIQSELIIEPNGKRHAIYWIEPTDIERLKKSA